MDRQSVIEKLRAIKARQKADEAVVRPREPRTTPPGQEMPKRAAPLRTEVRPQRSYDYAAESIMHKAAIRRAEVKVAEIEAELAEVRHKQQSLRLEYAELGRKRREINYERTKLAKRVPPAVDPMIEAEYTMLCASSDATGAELTAHTRRIQYLVTFALPRAQAYLARVEKKPPRPPKAAVNTDHHFHAGYADALAMANANGMLSISQICLKYGISENAARSRVAKGYVQAESVGQYKFIAEAEWLAGEERVAETKRESGRKIQARRADKP